MSEQTPTFEQKNDADLRRMRELTTGLLAFVIVILYPVGVAILSLNAPTEEAMSRLKDMFLLVNPLLGFVLGYYFTKASTEARAESAEAAVKETTTTANRASQERDQALAQAVKSHNQVEEMRSAIDEVGELIGSMDVEVERTLHGDMAGGNGREYARQDLQRAFERLKRLANE